MDLRGGMVTAVHRPVKEQGSLRAGGRVLGARLGVYEVLQALPLGEWVPVDSLSVRERRVLPALPVWARRRRNGRLLRLADLPVRLDLLIVRSGVWREAVGRAGALGPVAPRMALCDPFPEEENDLACMEASVHGIGLAVRSGEGARVLVLPPQGVPEPVASLHWRLAERVFAQSLRSGESSPQGIWRSGAEPDRPSGSDQTLR